MDDDDEPLDEPVESREQDAIDVLPAEGGLAVMPENRITTPYLTKYEKARVLGTRALQIA